MTAALERLYDALCVPAAARVERWVPKSKLVEGGAFSTADRRLVEDGIERLSWRATLRPANLGVPAFQDEVRFYAEIVVMSVSLRPGAKPARLIELVHRAVTAPLVLVTEHSEGAGLSIGLQRRHEREAGAMVVERLATSPPIGDAPGDARERAYLDSLDMAAVPAGDLFALHEALAERAEAFAAARAIGCWRLPADAAQAASRRAGLAALEAAEREVARLRRVAATEKRLATRIDLSHQVARAEAELRRTLDLLT